MHPLASVASGKQILCKCEACGKEHKGLFYQCVDCPSSPLIHNDCVFLPKRLLIQQTTHDRFSHTHPLTLAYSCQKSYRSGSYTDPKCRVCNLYFDDKYIWIYECDKCRYYAHLDCATNTREPFMSILTFPGTGNVIKNYEDDEYPDLLHLPFPDDSYSLLKNLFYKDTRSMTFGTNDEIKKHISHEHPLLLVDITQPTASYRARNVSYHNSMKKIQLLCNGCAKPIITPPFYVCANEDENCDFVLHEWCTRLPVKVNDHPYHPQHPLIYYPKINPEFLNVFDCAVCHLSSNGFVYCCVECRYYVDVCCAFIPKRVTHKSHPNHLLSLFMPGFFGETKLCHLCMYGYDWGAKFKCEVCNIHLHANCALLVSETITHKVDKHPMKLSYFPIENHKSDYFCEICELTLDPSRFFYHCQECVQSVHTDCAPAIYESEIYDVNIKFGGIHNLAHVHQHPLSFVRGIETDVHCDRCSRDVKYSMTLKCLQCKYAIHFNCFKYSM
ncbi:uncharacterized protein [Rutidosis leptorrhynchoides]|uniref:uncharacterized protein n=1 Tax=Rutidosis leptorrhynchoides TaxID=125765 RepID=UPI003A9A24FC